MDQKQIVDELVDDISQLTRLLMQHQAHLFALHDYLSEQSAFDGARYGALYKVQCERLNLPTVGKTPPDAALQALLRDFEGPIQ